LPPESARSSRRRSRSELRLPFRLRTVLALGALVGLISLIVPRVRAVFRLHTLVSAYADYSLCLVGPTGPELFRRGSPEFVELLRARLVASGPSDRPFASCRRLAERMELRSQALLTEPASIFFEYFDDAGGSLSVRELAMDARPLLELNERAWPFGTSDPLGLAVASRHAKEAPHPWQPPQPGLGSGLPTDLGPMRSSAAFGDVFVLGLGSGVNRNSYVSANRGLSWRHANAPGGLALGDRCGDALDGRAFSLVLSESDDWLVLSHDAARATHVATLAPMSHRLVAVDCDQNSLLAMTEVADGLPAVLYLCGFAQACRAIVPPALGPRAFAGRVDGALLGGDIVLLLATGGLTRVTSSRDGGASWTPWTLAFDERRQVQRFLSRPDRFLHLGDDLLLLGGRDREGPYPVLLSSDHGASFGSPDSLAAASSPALSRR
jgi:hypothetical protein